LIADLQNRLLLFLVSFDPGLMADVSAVEDID